MAEVQGDRLLPCTHLIETCGRGPWIDWLEPESMARVLALRVEDRFWMPCTELRRRKLEAIARR